MSNVLSPGLSDVPPGKLAAVVTCLEMRAQPALRTERADVPWRLRSIEHADAEAYRALFRHVGSDWLWFSRLLMPAVELDAILGSPDVEIFALALGDADEGLLELDFREPGHCELAFFGLAARVQGQGAGRWLINRAIERAWARPIGRFWVHTCTLDHPEALGFYVRSGFRAYARRVEVADDPRGMGLLPREAAPGIPLIE